MEGIKEREGSGLRFLTEAGDLDDEDRCCFAGRFCQISAQAVI